MDDLEEVEIVFAQRLASSDPTIRSRALKQLKKILKNKGKLINNLINKII